MVGPDAKVSRISSSDYGSKGGGKSCLLALRYTGVGPGYSIFHTSAALEQTKQFYQKPTVFPRSFQSFEESTQITLEKL